LGFASPIVPLDVYEDVNATRQQRSSQLKSGWSDRHEKLRLETLRRPGMPEINPGGSVYAVDHSIVTIDGKNGLEEKVYQGNCRKVEIGDTVPRAAEDPAEIASECKVYLKEFNSLADGALYQIRTIYKLPLQVYDDDAQLFIDTVVPLRLLVVPAAQPQSPIGFQPDPDSQKFVPKVDKKLGKDLEAWLLGLSEHGVRRLGPGLDGPYRMQLLPIKP
ncbi:hypothetical protein FOZ62_001263, partial [Perkinsus olseni]